MLEQCADVHNFLYIHGAQGVGKSHALYEAVCQLAAQRSVRALYMHDCTAWRTDADVAVQQLAAVVASGFSPDRDPTVWDEAARVRSYADLERLLAVTVPSYCREHGLAFVAVFDQHNGLVVDLRTQLPWSLPERVLPSLASWKGIGATVISASANNEYFLKVAVDASWRRLDCYRGFSDAEVAQWRRHHGFFDGPEHADAWPDVASLLSNWPLDLNEMRLHRKDTLAKTLEWHRRQRLYAVEDREAAHLRVRVTEPRDRSVYAGIILDMLIDRSAIATRFLEAPRLINKHMLYYNADDDSVRPIHDLARQFYLASGYLKRAGDLADATIKDVLASTKVTADSKGRMLELYLVACMEAKQTFELRALPIRPDGTLGAAVPVFSARALTAHYFPTQGVPSEISWGTSALLVPLNSNYPGADLLLWDKQERVLVAIQVTVGRIRDHAMSFTPELMKAWRRSSGAKEVRFVWLAPAANVTRIHAGQYFLPLNSLQADLAPLVAHYVGA
jgi:hypothetical protein